ncbi:hypothetical protein KKC1_32200 [Calderihabitans maritimus]|uniref:Uncharacterized protein n=1 Tax=Calderihabitans maritimus TaxID=1246530 RepID=A0A1Z5HXR7_9FIRM|nr:hypothetical protein KKC1_32200 [Calderihabitans maritimus]
MKIVALPGVGPAVFILGRLKDYQTVQRVGMGARFMILSKLINNF